ncbi:MAG: phage tail tube protein [Novosphingobium sp.]|uniref:phage tail tube protein n=1 Tax=Novosphingobium sp. TaxID=1874826 RepID=UPI002732A36F|nr:phage tail tube protein [Novosphingobium sp.]MDP3550610.1 phage tail tube protein [Novosphingobium sp.]
MSAKPTFGVVLKIGSSSPPSTTLSNVFSVSPPRTSRDALDVTTHGSAGGVMEFMPDGVVDPGEMTVSLHYIAGDSNDTACLAALAAAAPYYFIHTVNAASGTYNRAFQGVVTSYGPDELGVKGKQTASMTIKVSGAVTQEVTA